MKTGPIILIDDDSDDKDVFQDILKELKVSNPIIWFQNCDNAFSYLKTTSEQPFIIFCDLNLPGISGIECKRQIDDNEELRKKSIPFVFCSTTADQKTIDEAYTKMTVQGFFQKKNTYSELKETIKLIVAYWAECKHPNSK
ncbi:MAG TPA: response regulator [Chitinophagaceae bacterium]|jgi:CheY-like chemotaxis protein|nr:response regulator [Chitinophagaceae bacterium]